MVSAMTTWTKNAAAALNNLRLEHPRFTEARKRLARALDMAMLGEVIVLCGPSRVGKTRCIGDVATSLFGTRVSIGDQLPLVYVEVANESSGGMLTTKALTADCLRAVRHPFYGGSELGSMSPEAFDTVIHRTPEATLKSAFERSLRARSTHVLVFDEAQHLKYAHGGAQAAARILDSWKCLASKAQIKLVLVGAFELLDYIRLSPHLLGRLEVIAFDRYRLDETSDVQSWERILLTLSGYLPFASTSTSLRDWNELLYEGSLGCVGLLLRWIRRALASLDPQRNKFLTRESLLATAPSKATAAAIAEEISRGETALQTWLSPPPNSEQLSKPAPRKSPRKPFRRKSKRIPLGGRASHVPTIPSATGR